MTIGSPISPILPTKPPIPPGIIIKAIKKIVGVGKKIKDIIFGEKGKDVSDKKPMDTKNGSVDDMMELNAVLREYHDKVASASQELEALITDACKEVFEQIIDSVEFANSEFHFYRVETLQRKRDNYLSDIDGIFAKNVAKKISMDNEECVKILKMLPGELKGIRMTELRKQVFQESIEELCEKLDDFLEDISDSMEMSVESKLDFYLTKIQEKTEIFEDMAAKQEDMQEKKEKAYLQAACNSSKIGILYMESEG